MEFCLELRAHNDSCGETYKIGSKENGVERLRVEFQV